MRDDLQPLSDDPVYPFFPDRPSQGEWHGLDDGKLPEVHLYDGSLCNRACTFCCVAGSPAGWQADFDQAGLQLALDLVSPRGRIKFYGGEPTIHPENVIAAAAFFRAGGFQGSFRLYTNGVLAERVITILDAVDDLDVILNYSILHGRGAEALPLKALQRLLAYPPGRIFSSHLELNDTGLTPEPPDAIGAPSKAEACPHCHPVLRSDGVFHGCPFAVEINTPHFLLGRVGDDPARLIRRFWQHIEWQKEHVEPAARRLGISACQVCKHHLASLPIPDYA